MTNPLRDNETIKEAGSKEVLVKPENEGPSLVKGLFSIAGLIVLGAVLVYGLPHLRAALKGMTSDQEEVFIQATEISDDLPEGQSGDLASGVDLTLLSDKVVTGIEMALRAKHRDGGDFFLQEAKYAEDLNQVRVVFELGGESRELIFDYVSSYDYFRAKVEDPELKKFFTRSPTFQMGNKSD